ncbi:hypothetical protein [Nocardia salmonicida]|uniref:hypothetical protein n=1 Tax=Nocardia salmonicida TaxID=53431 RepID=UPI0037877CFB
MPLLVEIGRGRLVGGQEEMITDVALTQRQPLDLPPLPNQPGTFSVIDTALAVLVGTEVAVATRRLYGQSVG